MPGVVAALALISSVVWGTADFGGGWYARRFHPLRVVAIAQAGGLLAMCLVVLGRAVAGHPPQLGSWIGWGALAGMTGAIALVSFYGALAQGAMGVVSPISSTGAVVPLIAGLLMGDRLTTVIGLGLVLVLIGIVLASGPELRGGVGIRPVLLAVVSAAGFGLTLVFMHQFARVDLVAGLWTMRLASVSMLYAVWRAWPGGLPGAAVPWRTVPLLFLVGCGDLAANGLFAVAARSGMVSVVAVLGSLYPVATLAWARLLLGERLRPVQWAGVALALGGIALTVA